MLKEKLKKALKDAGLKEGLADVINITSEDQIEGVVNQLKPTQQSSEDTLDFNKIVASDEFSEFVKNNGFDKVLELSKTLQSEHDKKVTKGVQTFKEKFMKTGDPNNGDGNEGQQNQGGDNGMPEWFKPFASKFDTLEKQQSNVSKLEKAKAALKSSSIPEKFHNNYLNRYNLESEESFEDQTKKFETEISTFQQHFVGESAGKGLPFGQQKTTEGEKLKAVAAMGDEFLEKRKKTT